MHQSVKLTHAISLLQFVISSPLNHALDDLSQAPTGIRTHVPSLRGRLTNWAITLPPPLEFRYTLAYVAPNIDLLMLISQINTWRW